MELKGKSVLITGGARIGEAVALSLAERGANVAMTYRSSKRSVDSTVRKLQGLGVDGVSIPADLGLGTGVRKAVSAVIRNFGRLDILVNMVSIYKKVRLGNLNQKSRVGEWEGKMESEVRTAYQLSLEAARAMRGKDGGRIILFSDWVAASGRPRYRDYLPYYVAKSAMVGLCESLALELAPRILVNALAPGPILPPDKLSAREKREVSRATPLGRWGGAKEIAKAVCFLVETDFVTGECIRVDGGRHLY